MITRKLFKYRTRFKFCGLNFRVFDWQENLWGINFHGLGGVVRRYTYCWIC